MTVNTSDMAADRLRGEAWGEPQPMYAVVLTGAVSPTILSVHAVRDDAEEACLKTRFQAIADEMGCADWDHIDRRPPADLLLKAVNTIGVLAVDVAAFRPIPLPTD